MSLPSHQCHHEHRTLQFEHSTSAFESETFGFYIRWFIESIETSNINTHLKNDIGHGFTFEYTARGSLDEWATDKIINAMKALEQTTQILEIRS